MSKLTELLHALGKEPELHDEYIANPEGVLDRYGLSEVEKQAMIDRNVEKLKELSGLDNLKSNSTVKSY